MFRAVIFDMDGTLIDTEKYYCYFWPKALETFGFTMSRAQALEMRSLGRPFGPEKFKEWFGETADYWAVREKRKEMMNEYLAKTGIVRKPGALEAVTELRARGYLTAVATASELSRTERYLSLTGLSGCFDRLISASMVERGKPAPDIYEYACGALGLRPSECLAVEDAPNGIYSAHAAGLPVVMVPDQSEPDAEIKKILYARIDSLYELPGLLG